MKRLYIGRIGDESFAFLQERTEREYRDNHVAGCLRLFRESVDEAIRSLGDDRWRPLKNRIRLATAKTFRYGADAPGIVDSATEEDAVAALKRLKVSLRANAEVIDYAMKTVRRVRAAEFPDASGVSVRPIDVPHSCINCKWMCFGRNEWRNHDARCALGLPRYNGEYGMHASVCDLWEARS